MSDPRRGLAAEHPLSRSRYTRSELAKRYACFYAGPALANMFGGLIAAAVLDNMAGVSGLEAWRWLYIIESIITVGLSVIAL